MQKLIEAILTILLITPSGALSPGPLTFATIVVGSHSGAKGGLKVAIGHTLVELPYVLALAFLLNQGQVIQFLHSLYVKLGLVLISCTFLTFFSYLTFLEGRKIVKGELTFTHTFKKVANPLVTGIVLTGGNPFFLIWWVTAGLPVLLVFTEHELIMYFPLLYIAHVWIDYAWLCLLAYLSRRGYQIFTRRYGYVLQLLAVLLTAFAILLIVKVTFS